MKSKAEYLIEIARLGMGKGTLMLDASQAFQRGDLAGASALYEELTRKMLAELALTLEHNERHEQPLDVPAVAQPIVNAFLMWSDVKDGLGDRAGAERLRAEALALAQKHLGDVAYLEALRSRAVAFQAQGRFREALLALTQVRDRSAAAGKPLALAQATLSMADILQWLGDLPRARRELEQSARALAPELARVPDTDQSFLRAFANAMGGGQFQDAQDLFQTRELATQIGYYQGLIAMRLGDYDEARARFTEVLPTYRGLGVGPAIEVQLAVMDVKSGHHAHGLQQLRALESAFRAPGPLSRRLPVLLRWESEAELALGDPVAALRLAEESATAQADQEDPDAMWKIQWQRGRCRARMGDGPGALGAYRQAADLINRLRKTPLGYRLDSAYLRDKVDFFNDAIRASCEVGDAESCVGLMEVVKSRILSATLSVPKVDGSEAPEERRVDELSAAMDAQEFAGFREGGWTPEMRAKYEAMRAERRDLLERLRIADPRWRTMTEPVPVSITPLTEHLAARGDAALALYRAGEDVVAVLVDAGGCRAEVLQVSAESWSKLDAYARDIQSAETARDEPGRYDPSRLAMEADAFVPRSLLERALAAKRLVLVPHRALHLLPWAALQFGGRRLFEACAVGVLPNLSCLTILAGPLSAAPGLALVGAPAGPAGAGLVAAANELAELATDYRPRLIAPPATGRDATEPGFRTLAGLPNAAGTILHIACHGTFDAADPMNSALLLTDGRIDGAEISRMSLRFEEVVLSACSTGVRALSVGDMELAGDDIVGLPGAFLEAGARAILVSIPPANDLATADLMSVYYEQRMKGVPPLLSLQAAQKVLLKESDHPPHRWLGFTAYGAQ
jgi:CHAT domain-containing protein/tetratricopeptide (TPR) repeat protein